MPHSLSPAPNPGIHEDDVRITGDDGALRVSCAAPDAVEQASAMLRREGVVVLDNLVDPALLSACLQEISEHYPDHDEPDPVHYLGSYPGRHTAPLVIDGTLANPAIFAPPAVMTIAQALLGEERILESFGLLVSLPGSPNQGRHFDGLLFGETMLDRMLPPVALSVAIPLVSLDATNGTTAFWRRSHREPYSDGPPDFAPALPLGSALVWDFRTHHSGRGNLGDVARPVLFAVHSRNWWQEPKALRSTHYRKLQIARAVHDGFDESLRTLTTRADIIE
jgi:hypothetical protein